MFRLWFVLLGALAVYASMHFWPILNETVVISNLFHYEFLISGIALLVLLWFVCESYAQLRSFILRLCCLPGQWLKKRAQKESVLSSSNIESMCLSMVLNEPQLFQTNQFKQVNCVQYATFYHALHEERFDDALASVKQLAAATSHPWVEAWLTLYVSSRQFPSVDYFDQWVSLWRQYGFNWMLGCIIQEVRTQKHMEQLMAFSSDVVRYIKGLDAESPNWSGVAQCLQLCVHNKNYFHRLYQASIAQEPHHLRALNVIYVHYLQTQESAKSAQDYLLARMQDDPHQIWVNAIRHVCQDLTTLRKLIEDWLVEYDWAEVKLLYAVCMQQNALHEKVISYVLPLCSHSALGQDALAILTISIRQVETEEVH